MQKNQNQYQPPESIAREILTTAEAAHLLNRRPQTLRVWACRENGPIRPVRINGRLAWPVSEIRELIRVGA